MSCLPQLSLVSGRGRITGALVGLVALVLLGWLFTAGTGDSGGSGGSGQQPTAGAGVQSSGVGTSDATPLSQLPPEAASTWELIEDGGPFPYARDGATFGNREGLLPRRPDGYYREYTVPTPGERDRGARRLVTGEGGELWYTADHYASFVLVEPSR